MQGLGRQSWFLAAVAALSACGEPLLSRSAYDSPILTVRGYLSPFPVSDLESPRVGVVWVDPAQLRDDVPSPFDTSRFAISDDGRFTLGIYAPPPAAAIRHFPASSSTAVASSFAFGELVLYEDRNGDARFDVTSIALGSEIVPPDAYRGASVEFLVYVETPLPASSDAVPELLPLLSRPSGYHLGYAGCANPETPGTAPLNPELHEIEVVVAANRTSTLPFERACLRTRPAGTTVPASPAL